jgi:uncharacterized tellurite resistance protein B-like protein
MAADRNVHLPDIASYPWQRRKDYLMLVAAVAASDDELHPDELNLLQRWIEQFQLSPKSRQAVLEIAHRKPASRAPGTRKPFARGPVARRLGKTDLTYSLMLDLMGMAMADGVLMDDEIGLLRGIADVLDFDPIDFNILIEFIHAAYQASQLDSPEPLYEYSIESAFQLLRDKHVRLFPHTLLCVADAAFDRQLKERWLRFQATGGNGHGA